MYTSVSKYITVNKDVEITPQEFHTKLQFKFPGIDYKLVNEDLVQFYLTDPRKPPM